LALTSTADRAAAHVDPAGCTATGVGLSLTTLYDLVPPGGDGVGETPVGAVLTQGETVYHEATLSFLGGANCAFEGGAVTIDESGPGGPDGVTPGGVPCIGGTTDDVDATGDDCAGSPTSLVTDQHLYEVDCADVDEASGLLITASAYSGGITHQTAGDTLPTSASTTIGQECQAPDIHVEKTADATPITAGDTASFTITVTNDGPGTATDVTLTDTLPGTGWAESPDDPDCTITPGADDLLECSFGDMAEGDVESVTVERETTSDDCGELPNTVTVAADNEEPVHGPTDNTDSATIIVECPGNSGCTPGFWKTHADPDTQNPGNQDNEWPVGIDPTTATVGDFFIVPASLSDLEDDLLWDALGYNGGKGVLGGAKILLRAAAAALLNSEHPDVDYPLTTAEIVDAVNDALDSGDRDAMLALAGELDENNNLGCTVIDSDGLDE